MKKIFLLIFSISIFLSSIGQNIKSLDDKNGFRDLKFGMNIDSLTNMKLDDTEGGLSKWYKKTDEKLSIGDYEIESIDYSFYRGKLDIVLIRTKGYSNSRGVLSLFKEQYGPGYKSNNYIEEYYWFGKLVTLSYDENTITNDATIIIRSEQFKELKKADKKESSEKAKKDL